MLSSSLELPDDFNLIVDPMDAFDPDEVYGGPDVADRLKEHEVQPGAVIETLPSWWTEFALQIYDKVQHQMVPFPFENRRYLKQIYDSPSDSFILLFGRQSEKCLDGDTEVLNSYGDSVAISSLAVGDRVLSYNHNRFEPHRVTKTYTNGERPLIKITTRGGRVLKSTRAHRILTEYGMLRAGRLRQGTRIGIANSSFRLSEDIVESIEDIGKDFVYDIEVEGTHNYVANGIVTHNSTTLGNLAITHCCLMPYVHILYVAPSNAQTRMFSKDRIKEPIEASPRVRAFTSAALTQNVFEKTFTNRSTVILKYAFYTADRIRGVAADVVLVDEIQDVLTDNIPVIEETMAHSPIKKRYYSGTPKTLESTLGIYWELSTQNEWVIPCDCQLPNRYWNILDGRNIGNKGLICNGCGKPINPYHEDACWASASKFAHNGEKRQFQGYRVPQIMVPIHQGEGWSEILRKKDEYPPDKFDNEVLGLFSDAGDRPITRDELMACCSNRLDPYDESMLENIRQMSRGGTTPIYAGIDWGHGDLSQSRSGYTVLSLGSYLGTQEFKIFYMRRFEGEESDPNRQLPIIGNILNTFNVRIIGADFGAGFVSNAQIQEMVAHRGGVVLRFQYSSNPQKKARYNEDASSFILHRSQMMGNMFNMLKKAKRTGTKIIHLPKWEVFEKPYGSDILSIYSEYSEGLRMIKYDHPLDRPDDSFHSILYCLLASTVEIPRKDIFGFVDIRTGA